MVFKISQEKNKHSSQFFTGFISIYPQTANLLVRFKLQGVSKVRATSVWPPEVELTAANCITTISSQMREHKNENIWAIAMWISVIIDTANWLCWMTCAG